MPARIRKDDRVVVLAGKDKGKTGKVLEVRPRENRVIVEGINIIKRHTKPRPPDNPGGVIERPAPIHLSNVAPLDPQDKRATRIRVDEIKGERLRVSARTGHTID
jgi:large subunit ribosomal protein L24